MRQQLYRHAVFLVDTIGAHDGIYLRATDFARQERALSNAYDSSLIPNNKQGLS